MFAAPERLAPGENAASARHAPVDGLSRIGIQRHWMGDSCFADKGWQVGSGAV